MYLNLVPAPIFEYRHLFFYRKSTVKNTSKAVS